MRVFIPDETLVLAAPKGEIFVLLAECGFRFPWANDGGKVVFGPPIEGTDMEDLSWETHRYWVVEALDENENPIELSPEEYRLAVETAEEVYGALGV